MKGFRHASLAAALIMTAGLLPSPAAHAQDRPARALVRNMLDARGARIGVSVEEIENATDAKDAKQPKAGVLVETVEPGGPADKAGIKAGDAITEFDGEHVRGVRQFSRLVQETPSGRSVAVALSRAGQRVNVTVTTESSDVVYRLFDNSFAFPTPPTPPPAPPAPRALQALPFESFRYVTGRRLGVTLESLDDQLAQYFGVKEGVLVKSVADDSSAQKAGVKAGDVITSVNGRHVYEVTDVNRAIERMENTDEFTLDVMRDKKPLTLKGKLESRSRGRGTF